jgi:RES domain-containing protein
VLWRISNHSDLTGLGGERTNGRWHTTARGKRIVYLSEHPALALVETVANLKGDPKLFPESYQLIRISVADGVSSDVIAQNILSDNWHENLSETQLAGDLWLAGGGSALLGVPSAPSPESLNYLFNPRHSDAKGLAVEWHKTIRYDRRLFHV